MPVQRSEWALCSFPRQRAEYLRGKEVQKRAQEKARAEADRKVHKKTITTYTKPSVQINNFVYIYILSNLINNTVFSDILANLVQRKYEIGTSQQVIRC